MTIEGIRCMIVTIMSAIITFLQPIGNDLTFMISLFIANGVFGLLADLTNGGHWSKKKAAEAIIAACLFLVFVTFIYFLGYLKKNMDGSLQLVSIISYIILWFYGTNICRNMKNILPDGSLGYIVFAFIYELLSLEGVKRIPHLEAYLKKQNKHTN